MPADVHLAAGARQRDHVVEDDVEGAAAVAVHAHPVVGLLVAVQGDLESPLPERLHLLRELDVEMDSVGGHVPAELATARSHRGRKHLCCSQAVVFAGRRFTAEIVDVERVQPPLVDLP